MIVMLFFTRSTYLPYLVELLKVSTPKGASVHAFQVGSDVNFDKTFERLKPDVLIVDENLVYYIRDAKAIDPNITVIAIDAHTVKVSLLEQAETYEHTGGNVMQEVEDISIASMEVLLQKTT